MTVDEQLELLRAILKARRRFVRAQRERTLPPHPLSRLPVNVETLMADLR